MPREAKPENGAKRLKTERWRTGQRAIRRPEAAHVDVALAAAFAATLVELGQRNEAPAPLFDVVTTAINMLEARGFDSKAAKRKTHERLQFRKDLPELRGMLAPSKIVTTGS